MPEVQMTPEAAAGFETLPTSIKARVRDVVMRLTQWPNVSGAKPLRYELKGAFRIRTGAYRIVFVVRDGRVLITRIDNRRDVYRKR